MLAHNLERGSGSPGGEWNEEGYGQDAWEDETKLHTWDLVSTLRLLPVTLPLPLSHAGGE